MKTLKILSENAKGLFTDKNSQNDLSTEVKKLFDKGETKIKIEANGKDLILKGYLKRGETSTNSPFTYIGENKKFICAELRKYFGLPTYTKSHAEKVKTFSVVNLELATAEQLKDLQKQIAEELQKREENRQKRIAELKKQLEELQNA
jgi:hypothetical protein